MMDMKERKYVKFRVDMYEDTKFKIIDRKPERDLIHYVWTRFVILAGKVNLEGDLYLSKNIPYTIETLAIEFNRDMDQIELALNVLIELEMIELTEENIYRVKNFAKHQNIKIKEKNNSKGKGDEINNKKDQVKENLENEIHGNDNEDEESGYKIDQNQVEKSISNDKDNLEITHKDIKKIDNNMRNQKVNNNLQNKIPILLENEKKKKKGINIDSIDEDVQDNGGVYFYDTDEGRPLAEGELVTQEWYF